MTKDEQTVLLLQGGGALGAYQAGVYEGIAEAGLAPDWIAGVSIGAINAALIAGNRPEHRLLRLREFWDRVSSSMPLVAPAQLDPLRISLNRLSATTAAIFGVPGFFVPRSRRFSSLRTARRRRLASTTPRRSEKVWKSLLILISSIGEAPYGSA
jgi:predicted acylesterase/phospholipase RssA